MAPKLTVIPPADDPQLRLDVLLLKLGEAITHFVERKAFVKLGVPLNLWDSPDGLRSVIEAKIQELQIDRPLSVGMIARGVGFVKPKPRIRKAG